MDLIKIAAELFMKKAGGGLDIAQVLPALTNLLPSKNGDLDLASLVGLFNSQGGGLAAMAASFLGDGSNDSFSAGDVLSLLGESKVNDFASSLGMSTEQASSNLSDMIPDLIDKSSEGGSLVEDVAGKIAGNLLGKLF